MINSKLGIIILYEYRTDIASPSFWLTTLLVPVLYMGFCILMAFIMNGTPEFLNTDAAPITSDSARIGDRLAAMIAGLLLSIFLMIYGAQIYSKVRKEKVNRIVEVLATSVEGRTLMLGKILSVLLIAMTQVGIWVLIGCLAVGTISIISPIIVPTVNILHPSLGSGLIWTTIFFLGGYLFYGTLYAAFGAMTDKDNENHGYMTLITLILLGSFYIEQYAAENMNSLFITICSFIPFTAPAVATVGAVSGQSPLLMSILQALVLYFFALISVILSGKVYTSSLLLKGRKFTPADIMVFLKSK